MNRFSLTVLALLLAVAPAVAQGESLTAWQWYEELRLPEAGGRTYVDFVVPPSVFDKARADLADLRLYDGQGKEVPYTLRTRRTESERSALDVRQFNRVTGPDRSAGVSLDLGEHPAEHNQLDLQTTGGDFRRRVHVEGSNNDRDWSTVLDQGFVVLYQVGPQRVDVHTLRYPPSRFRYLRVRVFPDTSKDRDAPALASVVVSHVTEVPGEYQTLMAMVGPREAVRTTDGTPGSAWYLTFGGDGIPCERLRVDVVEQDFVRPFVLESAETDEPHQMLANGEWRCRAGADNRPLEITFSEHLVHRLRLVVTDYRNAPLTIKSVESIDPVRQVVFAGPVTAPVRLYFGNPNAQSPHYDFAASLPAVPQPAPTRATLGDPVPNPDYQPVPKPWSERFPWLVYVVLGTASAVLLALLGLLARQTITLHDRAQAHG